MTQQQPPRDDQAGQPYGQPQQGRQPGAYYPPNGYYQPVPYRPTPPQGFSIASLVMGLASFFFGFTFLLPIGAIVLGIVGLRREPAGRALSITGIITGGICLLGWVAIIVGFIVLGGLALWGVALYAPYATDIPTPY
jgi:hypothetical protein